MSETERPVKSPEQELTDAERQLQSAYVTKAGTATLFEARRVYRAAVKRWVDHIRDQVGPP